MGLRSKAKRLNVERPQLDGRARPLARVVEGKAWFSVANAAGDDGDGPAIIDIYDEIGWYGVTAAAFLETLRGISNSDIEVHINSPGGDVYDGIAIYNGLLDHEARVTVKVDGLAASAASFIAQAGDEVIMGRNSEMMIHDALGLTIGNAADHRVMADMLDKASDNLAAIYAARAGNGGTKTWRKRMEEETWYSASEAVAAGLADSVAATPRRRGESNSAEPKWDLSAFRHQSRDAAPEPELPRPADQSETAEAVEESLANVENQTCPECGAEVSDNATTCPECGASLREDDGEEEADDLLALADLEGLPALDVRSMHRAFLDAADEAQLIENTDPLRMVLVEDDFPWDPATLSNALLDVMEEPTDPPAPPPKPEPTTVPITQVADALREALMP